MAKSSIEWTQSTWNPITGCTKVSPGCKNCYAERMSKRLKAMGLAKYSKEFTLSLHDNTLGIPLAWATPRIVFVNSMSDLFHEQVPFEFIQRVFDVMKRASWHQFQVLTKRSTRLSEFANLIDWPSNVWMGVSIESQEYTYRIEHLVQSKAQIKFLSLEPLLGPLSALDLSEIDWVIVGGESGPNSRPMERDWVVDIRDQCLDAHTPFFFKQWGGVNKKKNGRLLQNMIWDQLPNKLSR
jgi:protein gp37